MTTTARRAGPDAVVGGRVANSVGDGLTDALVQTSFAVVAALSQVAAAHDLSLTQLRVLAILRDHEPKMAELAAHLGLERSTVSGLVDRAITRGLVRRRPDPDDARAAPVTLTAAGRRLAAKGAAQVAELLAPLVGRLPDADQRDLESLLARLLSRR